MPVVRSARKRQRSNRPVCFRHCNKARLATKFVTFMRLAFRDVLHLRLVQRVQFMAVRFLLREQPLRFGDFLFQMQRKRFAFAFDVAQERAKEVGLGGDGGSGWFHFAGFLRGVGKNPAKLYQKTKCMSSKINVIRIFQHRLINHRPRKTLGYLTPHEVLVERKPIVVQRQSVALVELTHGVAPCRWKSVSAWPAFAKQTFYL